MTKLLTPAAVEAYHRDGYFLPVTAMSPAEARHYRGELEAFEARLGKPLTQAGRKYRSRTYLLFKWANDLVRHPKILDAVEDVIGPDILVFTTTWFIKEPGTPHIAGWHQDATHFGLEPHDVHVTAWLALSDATLDSGCMEFVAGSHKQGQMPHGYVLGASVNDAEQYIQNYQPGDGPAVCHLQPGQFSLHNTLVVHQSGPNHATDRRIGIGISYVPTSARHTGSRRHTAHLVRGTDRYGHFDLDPAPVNDFDAAAQAVHAASFESYASCYAEQVVRHKAETAAA